MSVEPTDWVRACMWVPLVMKATKQRLFEVSLIGQMTIAMSGEGEMFACCPYAWRGHDKQFIFVQAFGMER